MMPRSPTNRSLEAQVVAAQAQVKFSQINLDYTEIRSPIDGMIGRTAVTDGNESDAKSRNKVRRWGGSMP